MSDLNTRWNITVSTVLTKLGENGEDDTFAQSAEMQNVGNYETVITVQRHIKEMVDGMFAEGEARLAAMKAQR